MPIIWLDTDIGGDVDDAVSLLCAIRHPDIELLGVSTVLHRVEINTWIAREMLNRAGLTDIGVLPGAIAPMGVDYQQADFMPSHGRLAPELPRLSPDQDEERVAAIAAAMKALPEPFHLLTVGPLTNIGRLLDRHPEVADKWSPVTCMAGWLDGKPEYNVQADPKAARTAFERLNPHLVGLEASTYHLTREETEAALDPEDPASAFLLDCYREYRAHADWHADRENAALTLFDAITLLSLIRPDLFDFQSVRALVEKDGRMLLTDDGAPITYALSSDWPAIKSIITALLGGSQL
jgi:inosine-uridine nucleoside N-ribohydrolase